MANELQLTNNFRFKKDSTVLELGGGIKIDVSGTNAIRHRQTIATSETAIDLGTVTAGGYAIFINRDATNFVELRSNTGVADLVKIKPGELAIFRLAADAVPYAIADTASCELEYIILDD